MDKDQLRDLITRVLKAINDVVPFSQDAVELLMLTASQESNLGQYIKQINGPALGIFQMEPTTEQDLWFNFLNYRPALRQRISRFLTLEGSLPDLEINLPDQVLDLEFNLAYQIVMARLQYFRMPEPLPDMNQPKKMAEYYKQNYNTYSGKATVEEAEKKYKNLAI